MQSVNNAIIVGSGVSGLTTAIRLAEAGLSTSIISATRAQDSTSVVAAAIWHPQPDNARFMDPSFAVFSELMTTDGAGVYPLDVIEYLNEPLHEEPAWAPMLRSYRVLERQDVPDPYMFGHVLGSIRIESPLYLSYLEKRYTSMGGTITIDTVDALATLSTPGRVVVNCSGLGARHLAGDRSMYPVKGQVVHVRCPSITNGIHIEVDDHPLTYVLPRNDVVVLGGLRIQGDWSLEQDYAVTERILRDTRLLDPRLEDAEVVDIQVGLRPGRPTVRVEVEQTSSGPVVHNYGHDGNGYAMSWGCADEVVRLVEALG